MERSEGGGDRVSFGTGKYEIIFCVLQNLNDIYWFKKFGFLCEMHLCVFNPVFILNIPKKIAFSYAYKGGRGPLGVHLETKGVSAWRSLGITTRNQVYSISL